MNIYLLNTHIKTFADLQNIKKKDILRWKKDILRWKKDILRWKKDILR